MLQQKSSKPASGPRSKTTSPRSIVSILGVALTALSLVWFVRMYRDPIPSPMVPAAPELISSLGAGGTPCSFAPNDSKGDFFLKPPALAPYTASLRLVDNTKPPLLSLGPQGSWESVDVLAPSVLEHNGRKWLYYSGFDGRTWRTGLATSQDGGTWARDANNPIIDVGNKGSYDSHYIAGNGDAVRIDGRTYFYYQATCGDLSYAAIALAVSKDGRTFEKTPNAPVLTPGSTGSWDEGAVADPNVISFNGKLYMYYLGQDRLLEQRLGLAVSDDGVNWIKHARNPILDIGPADAFDARGLGTPAVVYQPPYFVMLYTGRSPSENRNIGVAVSRDGVSWRKLNQAPLIPPGQRVAWNSGVIADPSFLRRDSRTLEVFYGGGDKPLPAENLNGQIGSFVVEFDLARPADIIDAAASWARTDFWAEASDGIFAPETWDAGKSYA